MPHLLSNKTTTVVKPEDDVALSYYRLERCFSGIIDLGAGGGIDVKSPTDVGTRKAKDKEAPLSSIIEILNQRFHTDFKEEDRLFFEQIKEKACNDEQVGGSNPPSSTKEKKGLAKMVNPLIFILAPNWPFVVLVL